MINLKRIQENKSLLKEPSHEIPHFTSCNLSSFTQFTTNNNENLVELSLNVTNTPASTLTETSILYTEKTHGYTDGRTDKLVQVYTPHPPPTPENIRFVGV